MERDYHEAGNELKDSRYYDQVTNRAERNCVLLYNCAYEDKA